MARKKVNVFYELVRRYREVLEGTIRDSDDKHQGVSVFSEEYEVPVSDEIREEVLGLYCSRGTALNEKDIWESTESDKVYGEETISLRVRKMKETIEDIDLITIDEFNELAERFENEIEYS